MTVEFKIWKMEELVEPGFASAAVDAIELLDSQIDTNLTAEVMSPDIPTSYRSDFGKFIEDDMVPHVVENEGCPADNECHIGIVNTIKLGAGYTLGPVKQKGNPFQTHPDCNSSEAGAAGVNTYAALGGTPTYPGGDDNFEVTVIHNAIHALTADDIDTPSDDCSQDHSQDHSLGEINSSSHVSPAQIWYTTAVLSGNLPPCDNCSGNPEKPAGGSTTEISSCTKDAIAYSADKLGY